MTTTLTKNFSLEEFTVPALKEAYPAELVGDHLFPLAALCQWLRDLAGVPGHVNSAYRSPVHNADVDGVKDSQHMEGDAADVSFLLCPLRVLAQRVQASVDAGGAPAFGQVILYADKGHVHVSNPAARLGARNGKPLFSPGLDGNGKRIYTPLRDALDAGQVPTLSQPQTREGLLSSSSPSSSSSPPRSSSAPHGGAKHG